MNDSLHLGTFMTEQQTRIIEQAVSKERTKLFRFIKNRVANEEDAQDILQDVYYQLASNHGIVESIENMASWLYRVARNKIIDSYRKRKTESIDISSAFDDDEDEGYYSLLAGISTTNAENPDELFERQLVWETMYEALNELPEEQREVFILHELENKSFNEISELKGIQVNTLLSRKRYAVVHLRERLKNLYDEFLNKE